MSKYRVWPVAAPFFVIHYSIINFNYNTYYLALLVNAALCEEGEKKTKKLEQNQNVVYQFLINEYIIILLRSILLR